MSSSLQTRALPQPGQIQAPCSETMEVNSTAPRLHHVINKLPPQKGLTLCDPSFSRASYPILVEWERRWQDRFPTIGIVYGHN